MKRIGSLAMFVLAFAAMNPLFASTDPSPTATCCGGFLPENFWQGVLGTIIYFSLAMLLFAVAYKVVDWITPGNLGCQLLGLADPETKQDARPPNVALAIVVGALLLGMCNILAAAIK